MTLIPLGRRPWDSNWPMQPRRMAVPYYNKSVLDAVYEEDGEEEEEEKGEMGQKVDGGVSIEERERRMMDMRTVIIGCGTTEMKVG